MDSATIEQMICKGMPDARKVKSENRSGFVAITEDQEPEIWIDANYLVIERDILADTVLALADIFIVWVIGVVIDRLGNENFYLQPEGIAIFVVP